MSSPNETPADVMAELLHDRFSASEMTTKERMEWIDRVTEAAQRPAQSDLRQTMPATRKQLNYLEHLIVDVVDDGVERFEAMANKHLHELTREEATEWIGRLSGRAG